MEAGNTSIEMRNMGVSILDTLLRTKAMNKGQYQKLVKKYFRTSQSLNLAYLPRYARSVKSYKILIDFPTERSEGGNRRLKR